MKKLTILVAILCLILVLGLAGCKDEAKADKKTSTSGSDSTDATTQWDLSALYGTAGSYKCTARLESPQGSGNMIVWIKGNKERIEFTGPQGTAVSIFDGQKMYSWAKGQDQGIMMAISDIDDMQGQTQTDTRSLEDFNRNAVDIDCKEESVSDSLLNPPSNVQFTDMAEMLANLQNLPMA